MRYTIGLLFILCGVVAVSFTSCKKKKDPCQGVLCFNEGTCINGNCICADGFHGTSCEMRDTTTISFKNNTFTPVTVTANGETKIVPKDSTVSFRGLFADTLSGVAYTYLKIADTGARIGGQPTWAVNSIFPRRGIVNVSFDVPATMFFLNVRNTSSMNVNTVYVNYGSSAQAKLLYMIPNNGQVVSLGYYFAYTTSNVKMVSPINEWLFYPLNLPFTVNQSDTVTAM